MVAGLNVKAKIWRFTQDSDDEVGGAQLTGTVYRECIGSRFVPDRPSRLLRQQGVEVTETATGLVRQTKDLVILEGDEYEIVGPDYHPEFGNRWLIQAVTPPNVHPADRRGMIQLALTRETRARTAKVQQ